jgi:hypothetical protein
MASSSSVQIDAKPYTVWNLTPKGWFVISSSFQHTNDRIKYPIKTIETVQLNTDQKSESLKLISSTTLSTNII